MEKKSVKVLDKKSITQVVKEDKMNFFVLKPLLRRLFCHFLLPDQQHGPDLRLWRHLLLFHILISAHSLGLLLGEPFDTDERGVHSRRSFGWLCMEQDLKEYQYNERKNGYRTTTRDSITISVEARKDVEKKKRREEVKGKSDNHLSWCRRQHCEHYSSITSRLSCSPSDILPASLDKSCWVQHISESPFRWCAFFAAGSFLLLLAGSLYRFLFCVLSLSFLCLSFPFNLLIEVMLVFIEWLSSSRISWYVRLETLVQRKPWRMILYTVVYPASPFHVISFSSSCLPSTQHNRNRMIQVIHYRSCFVNEEAVFFDTEQLFFFLFTLLKSLFWRLFFSLYNKHRRWREEKKRSVVKWRQQSIKIIWLII